MSNSSLVQAVQHFQSGHLGEAEAACAIFLQTQPDDHRAHQVMALIRHEGGDRDAALDHIMRAVELAPDIADYHANHGAILHAHGDNEGALAAYRRARDAAPTMPGLDNAIALLLDALDRPIEAVDAYKLALTATPNDAVLHLGLGSALRASGDSRAAIDSFRKSIALQQDIPDSHYNLAVVLMDDDDYNAAHASLQYALKLAPDIAVYYIAMGRAESARGHHAAAKEAFRRALTLDPNGETYNLAGTITDIDAALERGNFARADQRCRIALAEFPGCPWWPYFNAEIAAHLKMQDHARRWIESTKRVIEDCRPVRFAELEPRLTTLEAKLTGMPPAAPFPDPAYLLIKCWGYGFWSDVSHVLASLLLAEMTGRIPVIHWGQKSYYTDAPERDAFSTFYKPPNDLTLADVTSSSFDYFPEKWNPANLKHEGHDIWFGDGSRQSGIYLLNRPEKIVVSEFYTQLSELLTWLGPQHPLHGMSVGEAYYTLYKKFFTLQPEVQQEVDAFIEPNFGKEPILGVHIRNIDKGGENSRFEEDRAMIMPTVERLLEKNPDLRVFLLTDTSEALEAWQQRFGDRVFNTDSARTSNETPLTWRNDVGSHYRLGVDVIRDTYAAAACDQFVGLGCSNVAGMVTTLKRWRDEDLHIIGDVSLLRENWLLHDW